MYCDLLLAVEASRCNHADGLNKSKKYGVHIDSEITSYAITCKLTRQKAYCLGARTKVNIN